MKARRRDGTQVDPLVGDDLLRPIEDVAGSHPVEDPECVHVRDPPRVGVSGPLVECVPRVPPGAGRQVRAVDPGRGQPVHLGILVVEGHACREHVAEDHPLRGVPDHEAPLRGRIAAFETTSQADQLSAIPRFLLVGKQRVAPVVDDRAGDHHASDPPAVVRHLVLQMDLAEQIQGLRHGAPPELGVTVEQVPQRGHFEANLRALPRCRLQFLDDRLQDQIVHAAPEVGQIARTQVESRMFGRRLNDEGTVDIDPLQVRQARRRGEEEQEQQRSKDVTHGLQPFRKERGGFRLRPATGLAR